MQAKIQLFSELLRTFFLFSTHFLCFSDKKANTSDWSELLFPPTYFSTAPAYSSKSFGIFSVSQCGICISHCEICIPHCGFYIPQCETENLSRNFIFYTREFGKITSPPQPFTPVRERLHDFKQTAKNGQRDFFCNFAAN